LLGTVREHFIQNRRHVDFRVWRGPKSRDLLDKEWEDNFWDLAAEHRIEVDEQVDTRRMVEEIFQQAHQNFSLEERVHEVALDAF
jgi:hypothetical protein